MYQYFVPVVRRMHTKPLTAVRFHQKLIEAKNRFLTPTNDSFQLNESCVTSTSTVCRLSTWHKQSTKSMLFAILLLLPMCCLSHMGSHQQGYMQGGPQQGHMQQGMSPQQYQGMPPQQGMGSQMQGGQGANLLRDKTHVQDKEHIKEHLQGVVNQPDVTKMSEEELQFHYFKMHDNDDNNKLDGCELIKSVLHWHVEESKMMANQGGSPQGTTKIFTDQELTMMIDPILNMDDRNTDGFIDYPEFVAAQKARGF